jgi:hypothetical protein
VGGAVIYAEIGLGFDDSSRQSSVGRFADKQLSQQGPRHASRVAIEKIRIENTNAAERTHQFTSNS